MSQTLNEFGLQEVNTKLLLGWIQSDLNSTNALVKNATVQLVGVIHRFVGSSLRDLIEPNVKSALMPMIDAEFEKNPQQNDFVPSRTVRSVKRSSENGALIASGDPPEATISRRKSFDSRDLLPRCQFTFIVKAARKFPILSRKIKMFAINLINIYTLLRLQSQVDFICV